MRTISQRDLRNNSAAVMDGVESGEHYRITRNGAEVAELRPVPRRRRHSAEELAARHARLPKVDYTEMRQDADMSFGEERVEDDPLCRGNSAPKYGVRVTEPSGDPTRVIGGLR